ncbi:hypothetical protein [Metabacillus sp. RGM 3146]|uniref:hypothetical protein n=1 Tax=Metabacillus sp. RGM 3146 TaxID=3401092 RepID=UPI003B9AE30F
MSEKSTLVQNMLIGAAAGAVVSLFHKPTRTALIRDGKAFGLRVQRYFEDPSLFTKDVRETTDKTRDLVQKLTTDVKYVNEKVNQLKATTPAVIESIRETKEKLFTPILDESREEKKGL